MITPHTPNAALQKTLYTEMFRQAYIKRHSTFDAAKLSIWFIMLFSERKYLASHVPMTAKPTALLKYTFEIQTCMKLRRASLAPRAARLATTLRDKCICIHTNLKAL